FCARYPFYYYYFDY
nr:immunoglobulin heavy chain junction region [Mus musculus]